MTISLLNKDDAPFGGNIHFVLEIKSARWIYLDPALAWITDGKEAGLPVSKFEKDDLELLQELYDQILTGNFSGTAKIRVLAPEGMRWLLVTPLLGKIQDEPVVFGTVVDHTDEVESYESITKFADKKNSILQMLGHDLRGPLNVAKSLTRTLSPEMEDVALMDRTAYIATILEQSIGLISNLIQREFLETASAELSRKRVEIVSKVSDYLEECKRAESVSGIRFDLKKSAEKIYIQLDIAKFMQVINNLISNSLKFTPAGGQVTVTIEDLGEQVRFIFADTGIGIPAELLPAVFDKFTRARRKGLQGQATLGLGLSLTKTIIDWHQGEISCESTEGVGTSFFILLPKGPQAEGY